MKAFVRELLRPWKLATFTAGLALLIVGARTYQYPDWDVGISVLMATLTYLTAPWATRVIWTGRWRMTPLAAFWAWLSVDGVCWWWNAGSVTNMMRDANALASLPLYGLCGAIWLYRGSLKDMAAEFGALWPARVNLNIDPTGTIGTGAVEDSSKRLPAPASPEGDRDQ
jgi:hypothetical protein